MKWFTLGVWGVVAGLAAPAAAADKPAKRSPKEALQAFNNQIGEWKGTGTPEGTREEKEKGFWTESQKWRWQFKGDDAWLVVSFAKGKHFARAELRYLPDKDQFQWKVVTPAKEALTFTGTLKGKRLILRRNDDKKKEDQQLTFSLLHPNSILYYYEVKPQNRTLYTKLYRVVCTKKGVPFASSGSNEPECVVSGGLGTIKVNHKGKTYYVCCSGCLAEFKANPEKYIKEYEARKAKKAKENK
jgi:hypothetical protein